ncbi:hypothetical protein C0992_012943 [Termitomyces sp. T32_za158]|nr:hypothetical protein C0992_012943 [Termitomyces sp. T32_za158]
MPFSKYFQDDSPPGDRQSAGALQFQLPAFIHAGPPMLAPGGGAEVLTFDPAWYANPQPVCAPSPLGLPVYSTSGFDVLSILARVAGRANPRIVLGPVDMTCSFVIVDVRRHDHPIVYCSPTFCRLTGYSEHEVLGRNCRFLQAPPSSGPVRPGESRRFTSQASVDTMRKALVAHKEVQTSIVNFRKDGSAFINLVSVIPVLGGERGAPHELNDVVYHVGFQVDLTEQPNAILDKLRDGSYAQPTLPRGPAHSPPPPPLPPPRKQLLPPLLMDPTLAHALSKPAFHRDLPITTSTTAPSPLPASSAVPPSALNNPLSLILLEYAPDFILVVSLKGAFLYVAPAISHVLGHHPAALVGRSISDLAHPEDVVPLERQLKESSTLINVPDVPYAQQQAKLIDVLFRARTAAGSYVWVEARGRLHVEPGKGRKAILLSARARRMPRVRWGDILPPLRVADSTRECWAQLSGLGKAAGAIVAVGNGGEDVFGCTKGDLLGRRISMLVVEDDRDKVEAVLRGIEERRGDARVVIFVCARLGPEVVRVRLVFYPSHLDADDEDGLSIAPPVILLHVALGETIDDLPEADEQPLYDPDENVFAELEVRRGSSWQYELQQLRFRNVRLREEVRALEKEVAAHEAREETPCEEVVAAGNPYPEVFGYDEQLAGYEGYEGLDMPLGMDAGVGGLDATAGYGLQNHTDHRTSFQAQPQPQIQAQVQPHTQMQAQGGMYAPQPIHSHVRSPSGLLHALGASSLHHNQHHHQHSHSHQQQHHEEIQRPGGAHLNRVRAYDARQNQQQQHPREVQAHWGAMHPGVKRAYGR